jgi:hypothetical protein
MHQTSVFRGFPPWFSTYAWQCLLCFLCLAVLFTSSVDEPSNPGTGPLLRAMPDVKRNQAGAGILETRGQATFTAGSEANINLAQRKAPISRWGGLKAKKPFNFQGRGVWSRTALPNPTSSEPGGPGAPFFDALPTYAPAYLDSHVSLQFPATTLATKPVAPEPAPATNDIPSTYNIP